MSSLDVHFGPCRLGSNACLPVLACAHAQATSICRDARVTSPVRSLHAPAVQSNRYACKVERRAPLPIRLSRNTLAIAIVIAIAITVLMALSIVDKLLHRFRVFAYEVHLGLSDQAQVAVFNRSSDVIIVRS